jgi:hypothetical protein
MKKIKLFTLATLVAAGSVMPSCIGSFALFNNVLDWNNNFSSKWVNEVVFIAFHIVPVYEVTYLVDGVVLNTVEFWTGSNPIAAGTTKTVIGSDGKEYAIISTENGYQITQGTRNMELRYDAKTSTWSAISAGQSMKLITLKADGTADAYLPNGNAYNVTLNQQGLTALRAATQSAQYAAR